MLNASVVARRVRERVELGSLRAISRIRPIHPRTAAHPIARSSPLPTRRSAAARRDQQVARTVAAAASGLRHQVAGIAAERRGVPLLAVLLLAVATLLTQAPGFAAAGATGGTTGAGAPVNARIVQINIDAPDSGQIDQGLVGALGADPAAVSGASGVPSGSVATGATSDVGAYTMVDGSLIKPITAESSPASDISGQVQTYSVRAGDTLSGVANRFGLSMMTIWWANHLSSKDSLKVGQKLLIPPVDGVLYTVQPGDTVTSIARRYHASAAEVRSFNGLAGDTVVIGQEVMVPDGRGAAIPTPTPAPVRVSSGGSPSRSNGSSGSSGGSVGGGCTSCSFSGSMGWPVPGGYISQYFWWGHPALDIAADYGTPVLAAAGGTVIYAGWRDNGGGYQVWISHGNNVYTTYNHMSAVTVGVGQHVGRGQQVGRIGATGIATGPHCHFEVWIGPIWAGGTRVNPLNYLSR